jgi:CHAT domain-containing protein
VWAFLIAQAGLLGKPIALGPVPDLQRLQADLARVIHIGKLPLNIAARFVAQQTQAARVPLATWHSAYVAPLQAHLAKFTHLLIIPDGLLHHIPFACLFDAATQRYLCEDFVIETAPSLTTWLHLAQRQRQRQAQDIAKPETLSNTNIVVGYSAQGRLAHAVDEARRVAQHMPASTMLLETNATRQNLIECASSANAQVIYLATHGLFRADAPAFSFIELADGKLFVLDILHSRLRAKLVVLSACETGVGKLTGNESMGLVRAFLIAGAQSVVATHWPVADHATTALMSAVLGHVATGKSAAQALQQAQCAFLASTADGVQPQYTHPYYWGSVFLNGYSSSVL